MLNPRNYSSARVEDSPPKHVHEWQVLLSEYQNQLLSEYLSKKKRKTAGGLQRSSSRGRFGPTLEEFKTFERTLQK